MSGKGYAFRVPASNRTEALYVAWHRISGRFRQTPDIPIPLLAYGVRRGCCQGGYDTWPCYPEMVDNFPGRIVAQRIVINPRVPVSRGYQVMDPCALRDQDSPIFQVFRSIADQCIDTGRQTDAFVDSSRNQFRMINDLPPTLPVTCKPADDCGDTMGGVVGAGLIKHGNNVEQLLLSEITSLVLGNEIGKEVFPRRFHCIVYEVLDVGKQFIVGGDDTGGIFRIIAEYLQNPIRQVGDSGGITQRRAKP